MPLSPQQRWARKQKLKNRCVQCSRKLGRYRWRCDHCQSKATKYMRRYREAQKKAAEVKERILGR